jgi:4-amino-4-deoxy-L-arabinose transferase-like glycosyltransferase
VLFAVNVAWRGLLALTFPLYYDEAYFWEWSRFPSLGYLDHPPMVAWVIGAFTGVLGERLPLAIRGGALLFGSGTLLLTHRLAARLFDDGTIALRALLLALCLPLLNVIGVVMVPDGPTLFFHLLALTFVSTALRDGRRGAWYLAGAAVGLALLSRLAAGLAVVALAGFLVRSPTHRSWLRRKEPYLALLLAALVASPFLSWNAAHEWASLRLQLWDRPRQTLGFSLLKTGEFLFEQLANTSVFLALPILSALCVAPARLPEAWREGYRLLRWQSLTVLAFFLFAGTTSQTHPHWPILAYPPAAIALAVFWTARPQHALLRGLRWWIALAQGTLVTAAGLALVGLTVLSRADPERLGGPLGRGLATARVRLFGWADLTRRVDPLLGAASAGGEAVLFAYGHQRASLLWFHRPGAPPVINLMAYVRGGTRTGDAQWYYIPIESLNGKSGILATEAAWMTTGFLRSFFEQADEVGAIEQRHAGRAIERYRVFRVVRLSADALRRGVPQDGDSRGGGLR